MKKQLILGASGFLGKALSELLATEGADAASRVAQNTQRAHHFDIERLEEIPQDYTHVYHCAAEIPYGNMDTMSSSLLEANVSLTQRVRRHFSQSRIIFASSVSVYGSPLTETIDESHPFNQPSAYGMSKLAGETIVRSAESYCILRLPSLYGPGMNQTTFIPRLLKQAQEAGELKVFGKGERMQNYLHVRDAAAMLHAAAHTERNGVFNAVAERSYSNKQIAEQLAELTDSKVSYVGNDTTPSFVFTTALWKEQIAFVPAISIDEGLKELVELCSGATC